MSLCMRLRSQVHEYLLGSCDRSSAGSGVCIIVAESQCHVSSSSAITNFNYCIIQALISVAHRLINVVRCYLPPASGRLDYDVARATSFVGDIHKLPDVTLPNYLEGDFNLRKIDWSSPCTLGLHAENIC